MLFLRNLRNAYLARARRVGLLAHQAGTLDDTSQMTPRFEGWTKRKLPWLTIDGLEASFEEQ